MSDMHFAHTLRSTRMRFVTTRIGDQHNHRDQGDRSAGQTGVMVVHGGCRQCGTTNDRTNRIAEIERDLHGRARNQLSPACTISSCCGDELKNSAKPIRNVSRAVVT